MHDYTVVVLQGAFPSSVAATVDMLCAAAALAPRYGVPVPRWRVCSPSGGRVGLQGGLGIDTVRLPLRPRDARPTWIVPGLGLDHPSALAQRLGEEDAQHAARAIAAKARAGGRGAASGGAVCLLLGAGVRQGRRATTSWWLAPLLRRTAPGCTVDADRLVCADGPVATGGAAFAQVDLMLHLLRQTCGSALVDALSRCLLLDARQAQAPFVAPELLANGDDLVARLVERMEGALPQAPTVAELASHFCMSERTLSRHVHRATGRSTLALLQSVRLRRARMLLESSRMSVDQVAEAVGYQDATALRRLLKKVAGASPVQLRRFAAVA